MPAADRPRRDVRATLRRWVIAALVLLAACGPAVAHKASDAYLSWSREDGLRLLRVDVALRDLDQLLPLDADDDGAITWGELRAARPAIDAAIAAAIRVEDGRCPLRLHDRRTVRRGDGHYESMAFVVDCDVARPQLTYRLLEDVDPTHRGLLRQAAGPQAIAPGSRVRLDALAADARSASATAAAASPAPVPTAAPAPAAPSSPDRAVAGDPTAPTAAAAATDTTPVTTTDATRETTRETTTDTTTATPTTNAGAPDATSDATSDAARDGDAPSGPASFLREGIRHILDGTDHLLFLLALLLPAGWARGRGGWTRDAGPRATIREVLVLVSTFTVAHSITLALGTLDWLRPPSQPIEVAIAGTIVLASVDNLRPTLNWPRAGAVFLFGLVHGFGFAGVLAEAQLPAGQLIGALLAFNVGVEIGQLGFVALALAVLLPLRHWPGYRRWILGAGSWVALAAASVWLAQRVADWIR